MTLGFQTFKAPRISRSSAYEDGKVVNLMQWPLLSLQISLVIISVRGWVESRAKVRPEGFNQWRITMTAWGIELMTFRPQPTGPRHTPSWFVLPEICY